MNCPWIQAAAAHLVTREPRSIDQEDGSSMTSQLTSRERTRRLAHLAKHGDRLLFVEMVQEQRTGDDIVALGDRLIQKVKLKEGDIGAGTGGRLLRVLDGQRAYIAARDFDAKSLSLTEP